MIIVKKTFIKTVIGDVGYINDLLYGIKIWTDLTSVLSQCTRLRDRRTDTFLFASPRCYFCNANLAMAITVVL